MARLLLVDTPALLIIVILAEFVAAVLLTVVIFAVFVAVIELTSFRVLLTVVILAEFTTPALLVGVKEFEINVRPNIVLNEITAVLTGKN